MRGLDQEEGDQWGQPGLEEPVDQHEDVLQQVLQVPRQHAGKVGHGAGVSLLQVDRDAQDGDHVAARDQVLEVGGYRRALGDQGGELGPGHRHQEGDPGAQPDDAQGVDGQHRDRPRHLAPLGGVDQRIEEQGQRPGQDEGADDAPDRDRQDYGQGGEHAEEEPGPQVPVLPQLLDTAALDHGRRRIILMSERPAEGVPADFPLETVALEMDLSIPKGLLGEQEFYKTVLLDSGWTLEPYRPNPDDEQIDFWIHLPGSPANVLCWQLKTTFELYRVHKAHRALFHVIAKAESLFTHPRMWYFLAFFDEAMRTFRDPVFVVPATFLHQL